MIEDTVCDDCKKTNALNPCTGFGNICPYETLERIELKRKRR